MNKAEVIASKMPFGPSLLYKLSEVYAEKIGKKLY